MYEAGFCKVVTPDEPDDQGFGDICEIGFCKVVTPAFLKNLTGRTMYEAEFCKVDVIRNKYVIYGTK